MTRVLIVEDNQDLAFGLRNNLEIEGYAVDVAADGPAGVAAARAVRPDLVVLDRDYFTVPDVQIKQIKSLMTIVNGTVVHDAGAIR